MKNNKGFSLVELIVVIAIMAILAAVAVIGVSVYIPKAQQAADDQLLHDINYIFQAACLENGLDVSDITAATWDMETMLVTSVNDDANHPVVDSFETHFDLTKEKFYNIASLVFDAVKHEFVDPKSQDRVTIAYGGGYISFSYDDINALNDSTFMEKLGVSGLLNKLDFVASFAGAIDNSASYDKVLNDADFQKSMLKYLGYSDEAIEQTEDLGAALNAAVLELSGEDEEAFNKIKANMAVLYAAQGAEKQDREEIDALLNSSDPKQTLISSVNNSASDGISQAAIYYGMYTSFAHHNGDTKRIDNTNDPLSLLSSLTDEEIALFKEYIASEQGQDDLDAYLASMNMINDSTQSPEAVKDVLVNGFNNDELVSSLQQATGNQ